MSAPTPSFELDPDGEHVWWYHRCAPVGKPDLGVVGGQLPVTEYVRTLLPHGAEKHWTVEQSDPLTVVPSILCLRCGTHGFITAGEWLPV